jgi:lipopolysaccharide/colanic/teichoic acid biosynthesis glycosyltransferase
MFNARAGFWPRLQGSRRPNGAPSLSLGQGGSASNPMRRFADIVISCAILFLTFPLLIVVALAIKYESPGPVFERMERIGSCRRCTLLSFRITAYDPEFFAPEWARSTTQLGRFLRYTQIETLPHLVNVVRGDLSLFERSGPPSLFCD